MPLFALISGYLFFWSMKKPTRSVLKKRLTSLLLPIFCWVTLECAGRGVIQEIKHRSAPISYIQFYADKLLGSLWFLWAIFWCSLIVLLVDKIFKGRVWIYGVILGLLLFTPAEYNFHMYAYLCPYFVSGYLFNKYNGMNLYDKKVKKDWYALAASGVAFVILFIFYGHDSYIYTTGISVLGENNVIKQLGIDIYRWTIGFAGSVAVIILCKMICEKWKDAGVHLFAYFGQISLGIYILNSYVNSYVLRRITGSFSPNVLIWILETVVSMAVYAAAVEIMKQIPVAKKLLLGGR